MPAAAILIVVMLLVAGCKPPPDAVAGIPGADPDRGRAAIERAGCGACHSIPGVRWPQGRVAVPLDAFADRGLIAGRLPNRPETLVAFVRDAPKALPGTTMPAMPLSEQEARDVAAYLYTLRSR